MLVGPRKPGSIALSIPPPGGAATGAVASAGASATGGGKGCGGGLVEPENGGVTAWAAILSGAAGVPMAAAMPAGTGGDVDGAAVGVVGGAVGGDCGVGEGPGVAEASGGPENGGVTALICDESDEGVSASVTSCSGGWSGAAGSPWKAVASSEYPPRARSETRPSASSRRCSGVLVVGDSGTLPRTGNGSVAPGVRSDDASPPGPAA